MNRFLSVAALACGLVAALMGAAGRASATGCDAVDCVPNVARHVVAGTPCVPQRVFAFGVDAANNTLVCASWGVWAPAGPLVGLRDVALPCYRQNDSAQESDGIPLMCANINNGLRWAHRADTPG